MDFQALPDTMGKRDLEANRETWAPLVPKAPRESLGRQESREKMDTRGAWERRGTKGRRGRQAHREKKENPGRKVTQEWRYLGQQGQRGLPDLRGSKAFLDQRGKQD